MKQRRILIEEGRLINLLRDHPGKYSIQSLAKILRVCKATMKKSIDEYGLDSLLKQRQTHPAKTKKHPDKRFFQYNKLDEIY